MMEVNWEKIKGQLGEAEGFKFKKPQDSLPSRIDWSDRLKSDFVGGLLPLAGLCVLILLAMVGKGVGLAVALVLTIVLALIFHPLTRVSGVWSPWVVMLLYPILVAGGALGMLLSTFLTYSANKTPMHTEALAWNLQNNLESVLTVPWLLFHILAVIALTRVSKRFVEGSPWLQPKATTASSWSWRTGLALLCLAIAVQTWNQSSLRPEEAQWKDRLQAFYESRALQVIPLDSADRFWREKLESSKRGEKGELITLDDHPPKSKDEFEACEAYLFRNLESSDDPAIKAQFLLEKIRIELMARPSNSRAYLRVLFYNVAKLCAESDLNAEELELLKKKTAVVGELLLSREMELDAEAYRQLWVDHEEGDEIIGWTQGVTEVYWEPVATPTPSPTPTRETTRYERQGVRYNGVSNPTPLKAFGYEFPWSPTIALKKFQRLQLTRSWLRMRDGLLDLPLEEQLAVLEGRQRALGHLDSRENNFWELQHREDRVTKERDLLSKIEIILANRLESSGNEFTLKFEELLPTPEVYPKDGTTPWQQREVKAINE